MMYTAGNNNPNGFAIYPQTNGEVIAWLDNLDPSKAKR